MNSRQVHRSRAKSQEGVPGLVPLVVILGAMVLIIILVIVAAILTG